MTRYRIAVCDDEPSELEDIVQSVKRYDAHGDFDIENYTDGAVLLSDLQLKKKSFDLLLLDIEMPSNGFQMAQTLTQMEKHPLVIFVTKRHEYAVQGYGIAFRYLVKPLDESLFAAAMDAVVQELDSKHFTVEYEGATLSLETSDIYYLESHGHKVLIHCKIDYICHIKPLSLYSKLVLSNDSLTANTHERLVILLKNNQKDLHVLQALIGLIN